MVIGGTFDILHKGHRALLDRSFALGKVFIGLTSDKMAREMKKRKIRPFTARKRRLCSFVRKAYKSKPAIIKIEDIFGSTLKEDFDYIVVSPETFKTAVSINKIREKQKKKPIKIVKIKFVLAEDGRPISATRISKGEIDEEGRLLKRSRKINEKIMELKI